MRLHLVPAGDTGRDGHAAGPGRPDGARPGRIRRVGRWRRGPGTGGPRHRTRSGRGSPDPAGAAAPGFSTPIDQEELYSLSELLDGVLNAATNIVREAEVLANDPDERAAELAGELVEGKHQVRAAFDQMTGSGDAATAEADAALAAERRMEKVYRRAMHACCRTRTCAK